MMDDTKIEKGIPMPASKTGEHRRLTKFPELLMKMEPGDSVFFPVQDSDIKKEMPLLSSKARSTVRRKGLEGWNFSVRRVEGGVRLWRVS